MYAIDETAARVRKKLMQSNPAFDAYLAYYPPDLNQAEHDHGCSQFSMILAGGLVEQVEGVRHEAGPGEVSVKPKGVVHSNRYGPSGALLLSFNVHCEQAASVMNSESAWHWRMARPNGRAPLFNLAIRCKADESGDLLWDLLSVAERRAVGTAPDWLRWVRSELDRPSHSSASISGLAGRAGVHRVHLSREFVRHYGLSPSAYRQRQMTAHAVQAMVDGKAAPAAAAHDAGFADQSHLCRAIRSSFGASPRKLAALLQD